MDVMRWRIDEHLLELEDNMNGHDDDFNTAFDPTDDERRAQEEDMWLEYEAMCAERDAALVDEHGPDVTEPDEPSDADLFDRGMSVGTAGWAWR